MSISIHSFPKIYDLSKEKASLVAALRHEGFSVADPAATEQDFEDQQILVAENGKPILYCKTYRNPLLRLEGKEVLSFGQVVAHNNPSAFRSLTGFLMKMAAQENCAGLLGPMDGSTWNSYRVRMPSQAPLFFLEPHNPDYYASLFEKAGFNTFATYSSHFQKLETDPPMAAIPDRVQRNVRIRNFRSGDFNAELKTMHSFCLESFSQNLLFTPISAERFTSNYLPLKNHIDERFVLFAESPAGELLGFLFALPNLRDTKNRGLIVKTLARKPSFRYAGLGALLASAIVEVAQKNNFSYLIHALMQNDNVSRNVSSRFSGKPYCEYCLFQNLLP